MPRMPASWYIAQGRPVPNWSKQAKPITDVVGNVKVLPVPNAPVIEETDAEIEARILKRFNAFEGLVDDVIEGLVRGMIVSGPPGMGKSHPVEAKLKASGCDYQIVKGHSSAKALYELLYSYSDENSIVVFDDSDSIFADEKALNVLKTALDTTETRVLSWLTSGPFGGEPLEGAVPQSYEFKGSIIFITNLDFDGMIAKQNRIAKHLEAIISRTHYVDLMIKSRRDLMIRIKQVVRDTPMLADLTEIERSDVMNFVTAEQVNFRECSLRTVLKVKTLRQSGKDNWVDIAKITCCKNP
jgi:hypothetical protein